MQYPASHVTAWGWFWLAWMLTGTAVELYWLAVNTANTLSRQVWGIEALDFRHPLYFSEWTWQHLTITFLLWGFFAWLSVHFPFGYLRLPPCRYLSAYLGYTNLSSRYPLVHPSLIRYPYLG